MGLRLPFAAAINSGLSCLCLNGSERREMAAGDLPMIKFTRSFLLGGTAILSVATASLPQARAATFVISGDPTNFAVLYEGNGGKQLQTNNSNITGNIGIGGTGTFSDSGAVVTGTVQFSAGNTGQYGTPSGGGSVSGGATYNNSNVSTDLTNLNTLSTTLGGQSGTSLAINTGGSGGSQTVNAASGILHAGVEVFNITGLQFNNGTTLFINGDAAGDSVVFNMNLNAQFGGTIVLSGLTADQVLFNIIGGASLTGGPNLQDSTNGATLAGDFLDPNGTIQINHSILDGRLFGGDTSNMSIVSGVTLNAPQFFGGGGQGSTTPLPAALPLFATGLGVMGFLAKRRKRKNAAATAAA
jgi:hypothetical protein